MHRTLITMTLLAALAPAAASAQSVDVDGEADARIRIAIDRAASAGVPEWLLENKVREGQAKGIPAERIALAVEHRAEVLARVRAALDARADATPVEHSLLTAGELTAAADAHEFGVSLENLTAISARAGNDRGVALTVLADLVAGGRASENALMRVEAALSRGGRALDELRGSADVRAGARVRVGRPERRGT